MKAFLTKLFTIRNADQDTDVRGTNLIGVNLCLIAATIILLIVWSFLKDVIAIITGIIIISLCIGSIALARQGKITLAGFMTLAIVLLSISSYMVIGPYIRSTPIYIIIPIVLGGSFLTPRQVWINFFVVIFVFIGSALFVFQNAPDVSRVERNAVWESSVLTLFFTLISYLISSSTIHFRQQTQQALEQAEGLARSLESSKAQLEVQVAERTAELAQALKQQQAQSSELQASLQQQQAQSETIMALSLPLIPVRHDVLVAPLIGIIDVQRAQHLLRTTLQQLEQMHARVLILDITGVALVDTGLAQTLLQIAQAAQLLGTQTILVGVQPEAAQTLISLNTDLQLLRTAATLQESLESIMSFTRSSEHIAGAQRLCNI